MMVAVQLNAVNPQRKRNLTMRLASRKIFTWPKLLGNKRGDPPESTGYLLRKP